MHTYLFSLLHQVKSSNPPIHRIQAKRNGTDVILACGDGCDVRLDSGTPFIAGPTGDITRFQAFIGAKKGDDNYVRS